MHDFRSSQPGNRDDRAATAAIVPAGLRGSPGGAAAPSPRRARSARPVRAWVAGLLARIEELVLLPVTLCFALSADLEAKGSVLLSRRRAARRLARLHRWTIEPLLARALDATPAFREFMEQAKGKGPLWTLHHAARDERLGGPLLQDYLSSSGWRTMLRSPVRFGLLALAAPLALATLALLGTGAVLDHGALGWQVALVMLLFCLTAAASALIFTGLRRTPTALMRCLRTWSWQDVCSWVLLIVLIPALGFAAISSLLIHHDLVAVKGAHPHDASLTLATFEAYMWNLGQAVPILHLPDQLSPRLTFPTAAGGGLLLAYELLVAVPLLNLGAIMLKRWFGDGGQ
jgi:hypothetical protein